MTTGRAEWGPLIVEADVDEAVILTLRLWLPTYLTQLEKERRLAAGTFTRPADESFATVLESDEQLRFTRPAVLATTGESVPRPPLSPEGFYAAEFPVTVTSVVSGDSPWNARAIAGLFGGCIRRLMVQQNDLGDFCENVTWGGSSIARLAVPGAEGNHLAACINRFTVFVDAVLQQDVGPLEPDHDYTGLPTVDDVIITVEGKEITAP